MRISIFKYAIAFFVFFLAVNLYSAPLDYVKKADLNQSYLGFSLQTESGVIEGKFKLKSGSLNFVDTVLKSLEFVADMESIQITQTDSKLSDSQIKTALCSHGFFNCDSIKNATIVSKRIDRKPNDTYFIAANLVLNNKPIEVKFVISLHKFNNNNGFITIFNVDRRNNKIKYISQDKSDPINDKYFFDNLEFNLYIILSK